MFHIHGPHRAVGPMGGCPRCPWGEHGAPGLSPRQASLTARGRGPAAPSGRRRSGRCAPCSAPPCPPRRWRRRSAGRRARPSPIAPWPARSAPSRSPAAGTATVSPAAPARPLGLSLPLSLPRSPPPACPGCPRWRRTGSVPAPAAAARPAGWCPAPRTAWHCFPGSGPQRLCLHPPSPSRAGRPLPRPRSRPGSGAAEGAGSAPGPALLMPLALCQPRAGYSASPQLRQSWLPGLWDSPWALLGCALETVKQQPSHLTHGWVK